METQTYQKLRDKNLEKPKEEASNIAALPSSTIANSPPSASSSPVHEFSFTSSLHQPPPTSTTQHKASSQPFSALDLSPADDIFFHGHLLPLHLLSHLPVSPRSSTNSLDSFTLPITDLFLNGHHNPKENNTIIDIVSPLEPPEIGKCHDNNNNNNSSTIMNDDDDDISISNEDENYIKSRVKSKSFSLFGRPKWRKGCEIRDLPDRDREKKKQKFDVSDVLKRYMKMVGPLLGLKGGGSRISQFHHQSYSFSGRNNEEELMRGRLRAQISAPASMRTSPTNSGLVLATGAMASSTSDTTMDELHAAIQAAITHCKNSIAVEQTIKTNQF